MIENYIWDFSDSEQDIINLKYELSSQLSVKYFYGFLFNEIKLRDN